MEPRGTNKEEKTDPATSVTSRDTNESLSENSSGDLPIPPDGGWGWVVVFASFMIHFIGINGNLTCLHVYLRILQKEMSFLFS